MLADRLSSLVQDLSSSESATAGAALHELNSQLLPPGGDPSDLLDEFSFELFEPALALTGQFAGPAETLLEGLVRVAAPREVFRIVMGALSTNLQPSRRLLLLRLLALVLPGLRRKRAELLESCFGSLRFRLYLSSHGSVAEE